MWPFKTVEPPKLTRAEAILDLESFIAQLDTERNIFDWAPALLDMLREFSREAGAENPDQERLAILHQQVHAYFKERRYLKGIPNVLWDIDTILRRDE